MPEAVSEEATARGGEPGAALVVVNHGSHELLARYLAPLACETGWRVVVVDNSPSDDSRRAAHDLAREHGWDLVAGPNDGFGAGVDRGVRRATALGCDAVLVVNPDLTISAADAAALVADARTTHGLLVGPQIERPDGSTWFRGGGLDLERGRTGRAEPAQTRWLTGACLAASVRTWELVGGFDPAFFLYWEDVDLSVRLVEAGGGLRVRDDLRAVHDVGGTQKHAGTRRKSDVYYRHNCRSRLVFAARHLDRAGRRRWLLGSPRFAWEVLLRGGRRQLRSPGPWLAAARGTAEGAWFVARHAGRQGGIG
ncbi:glycosyltransferase family 2 protein [Cellulomonas sp. HZM]|uniref:glycosyltransferase family 2 protein n=1 Tax=Cellulomonas sp. HZM TaxID=1454010 RepID=UPI00068A4DEF|nr:glycosyltransferase family 2 protein [Cellulomonas sp. HZM]